MGDLVVDSFFNPFHELYRKESDKHPHARTLRGGYFKKVKDTFYVLAGNLFDKEKKYHLGLISTVLLAHPLYGWCLDVLDDEEEPETLWDSIKWIMARILYVPSLVFGVITTYIIGYPLAALITAIAAVTVIPATQLFTWALRYSRVEKINQLKVQAMAAIDNKEMKDSEKTSSIKMLDELLTVHNQDLDSIKVEYQHALKREDLRNNVHVLDMTKAENNTTGLSFGSAEDEFANKKSEYGVTLESRNYLFVFKEGIVVTH